MTTGAGPTDGPGLRNFHEGEAALQAESGVDSEAFDTGVEQAFKPELNTAEAEFVAQRTFGVAATVDGAGRPWASLLLGRPGELFSVRGPTSVRICPRPVPGDPLRENIEATGQLGVLYFDASRRRRSTSQGSAVRAGDGSIAYTMRRHFGLCAKYIYQRSHDPGDGSSRPSATSRITRGLDAEDQALLRGADTAFLATQHVDHGADASHRGGPAGFVTVIDQTTISLPDYLGNGMFQTLGNLLLDDRIGLSSVDFATGRTVQVTGRGAIRESPADDIYSERTLRIAIDEVRTTAAPIGHWVDGREFRLRPGLVNPATPYLPGAVERLHARVRAASARTSPDQTG